MSYRDEKGRRYGVKIFSRPTVFFDVDDTLVMMVKLSGVKMKITFNLQMKFR